MLTEREQIIDLTKKLVEIPSITGKIKEALMVLKAAKDYLGNSDKLTTISYEHNGIVSQLWGDANTIFEPKLLLSGHVDVVNAPDNQFNVREKDGKLFGRGTGDMKGHIVSMLTAYKRYIENTDTSKGISLLLTSDDEVGGANGTRFVLESTKLRPSIVFIPDGEFSFDMVDSQKAPHHFHIRAKSTTGGGHVSKAFEKDNPVNKILSVYNEMREKYALASKDDEWKSTLEMTIINTGNGSDNNKTINSANQIAEWSEAWLAWRWPLEISIGGKPATYASGLQDLLKIAKKYGVEILQDGHGFGEGCYTNPDRKFVTEWENIIEKEIDHKIKFKHMHGATDGRHFYKYGADVLVTSGITSGAHSDNEWVDIDSLVKLAHAVYNYQQVLTK